MNFSETGGGNCHTFLKDGHVAADHQPQIPQFHFAATQCLQGRRSFKLAERLRNDLPPGVNQVLVLQLHTERIVVFHQHPFLARRTGEHSEVRIMNGRPPSLLKGGFDAIEGEIARFGSHADALLFEMEEDGTDAEPVGFRGLWFFHAVAWNVRRIIQAGRERGVVCHEDLRFTDVLLSLDISQTRFGGFLQRRQADHSAIPTPRAGRDSAWSDRHCQVGGSAWAGLCRRWESGRGENPGRRHLRASGSLSYPP